MSHKLSFPIFRLGPQGRRAISCGYIIFSILSGSLTAQTEKKPYDGDLREEDRRIKEQREKIKTGQQPYAALRLRYAGKKKNDLVFYDLDGQSIYYRYRMDRFDDLSEKKLPLLTEGQAYRVRGIFLGLSFQNIFIAKNTSQFQAKLKDRNAILLFQFQSAEALLGERILF